MSDLNILLNQTDYNMIRTLFCLGTFVLTLISTDIFAQIGKDKFDPVYICTKDSYSFNVMNGHGKVQDDLGEIRCSHTLHEANSLWLAFDIEKAGNLTFTISPTSDYDDIDYVLFKKDPITKKFQEVRCMATGILPDQVQPRSSTCKGPTGLDFQSSDEYEKSGCLHSQDNFLKFLTCEKGDNYILFINNYTSGSDISIAFDGNADFKIQNQCKNANKNLYISNVLPNPATKAIEITMQADISEKNAQIQIVDNTGKIMHQEKCSILKGVNKYTIDISLLIGGHYLIKISNENESSVRQFVKI